MAGACADGPLRVNRSSSFGPTTSVPKALGGYKTRSLNKKTRRVLLRFPIAKTFRVTAYQLCASRQSTVRIECLVEVGDDVADVFDADAEPNRLRSTPALRCSFNHICR